MHAEIGTVKEPDLRVQIVEQRAAFDQAPVPFRKTYIESQDALSQRLLMHEAL
jgi:magnesium chelatase subunit I